MLGVSALVVALGLATNVCVGLWTRSTVEAVAQDAARDLAATPEGGLDRARVDEVLDRARSRLGSAGARTDLRLEGLDGSVRLRVRHPGVSLVPRMLSGHGAFGSIDEVIVVGREDGR
ncbi:MAG: hypothetical protein EKK62_07600 [Acidimicrobiia bacterium]|nr:MAG: hypothetical protein EKK62_07600 [Acidimicrobiia bacterium]